jgi:hypothetical protein
MMKILLILVVMFVLLWLSFPRTISILVLAIYDRTDMSLGKGIDLNHPVIKWVKMLMENYDIGDLIDEHIVGEDPPLNDAECQKRLKQFFEAFEKKTGYTPEKAIKDIRGFMN